jgi:hypothetical protein
MSPNNNNIINNNKHNIPKHESDPFNPTEAQIIGAASSVIFLFLNVYFRERFNKPMKNDEYGARVISLIHSVISAIGCGYAWMTHTGGFFDTVQSTRLEADFAMFSFSYFLVDTVVMIAWKFDLTYFLHHIVTISFTGTTAFLGHFGFAVCFATWGGEFTNPMMHLRWLLHANNPQEVIRLYHPQNCKSEDLTSPTDPAAREHAHRTIWWVRALTNTWFVSFFLMRFFGAPLVVYYMVTGMPWFMAPLGIGIMVMSWKFFFDSLKLERKGEWWSG